MVRNIMSFKIVSKYQQGNMCFICFCLFINIKYKRSLYTIVKSKTAITKFTRHIQIVWIYKMLFPIYLKSKTNSIINCELLEV